MLIKGQSVAPVQAETPVPAGQYNFSNPSKKKRRIVSARHKALSKA